MNLPSTKTLLLSYAAGVLRVTFDRPQARNAMNRAMLEELGAVFDAVCEDRAVRAIVLRGSGGHFCAGGDMKEMMAGGLMPPGPNQADPVESYSRAFGTMLRKAQHAPAVVIAVCEGAVLGGGFGLACVSDIALAQAQANFGLPETTRGLPPAQIAPFVVERIGLTQARRLCLTGAQFDGRQALRLGIVHDTFADDAELQAKLAAVLTQVRRCAPLANALTKEIILNVARQDLDLVLDDAAKKFALAVRGAEAPEGIAAFVQKRAPAWAKDE
jgi:isohexenylglutaconyl-CoA hydratase